MTYRIKQIGSSYYPQTRCFLFFWCNFIEDNGDALSYPTLESAKNFLTVQHVQCKATDKVVIHKFKMWERFDEH